MKKGINPKIFLAATILLVVAGAGGSYWQYGNLSHAKKDLKDVKKQLRNEDELKGQLEQIKLKMDESSSKLKHLEEGVPGAAYIPTLLLELEAIGKQNQLTVTGVRPKESKKTNKASEESLKKAYVQLVIEVTGSGTYDSIAGFVASLEQFPKVVAINSLDLSPRNERDQAKGGPKVLDMTLQIKAFLFKEGSTDAGVAPEGGGDSNGQSQ